MAKECVVRYRRTLSSSLFKEDYEIAKYLMVLLYFFKKKFFPFNTLSYNPTATGWKPEDCLKFSVFLSAANLMRGLKITPKEYISAIVEYRRAHLMTKTSISEEMIYSDF